MDTAPTARKKNALGVFDAPLWRDWLAYLTLIAMIAAWPTVEHERGRVLAIDLAFALVFQFVVFGVGLGLIRLGFRSHRRKREVQTGANVMGDIPLEPAAAVPHANGRRGPLLTIAALLCLLVVGALGAGAYWVRSSDHTRSCSQLNEALTAVLEAPTKVPQNAWDSLSLADQRSINKSYAAFQKGANPNATPNESNDHLVAWINSIRADIMLRNGC